MKKRIGITGVSGVGKTTLANEISKKTGLEFISSSASKVWPIFGFDNHKDAVVKSIQNKNLGLHYQNEVFNRRLEKLIKHESFITDRTVVDNWVYFITKNGMNFDSNESEYFLNKCFQSLKYFDLIIYMELPKSFKDIEDNGRRILNHYYQRSIENVLIYSLKNYFINYASLQGIECDFYKISSDNLQDKLKSINEAYHLWED